MRVFLLPHSVKACIFVNFKLCYNTFSLMSIVYLNAFNKFILLYMYYIDKLYDCADIKENIEKLYEYMLTAI